MEMVDRGVNGSKLIDSLWAAWFGEEFEGDEIYEMMY